MSKSTKHTQNVIDEYKQRIEVMEAYLQGKRIEGRTRFTLGDKWIPTETPIWDWNARSYRVAPTIPDSIDWTHVHPKYRYMARDKNGKVYLYTDKPAFGGSSHSSWIVQKGSYIPADVFTSVVVGETDWRKSLVERPDS